MLVCCQVAVFFPPLLRVAAVMCDWSWSNERAYPSVPRVSLCCGWYGVTGLPEFLLPIQP